MAERAIPGTELWNYCYADHLARYMFAGDYVKGHSVLDVGTGPGYGAWMLLKAGASSVQAIDRDEDALRAANAAYGCPGLTFAVDDAQTLARSLNPVDVICSFENIEHLPRPRDFLASAARTLKPSGVLLCSTPDRSATPPFGNGKPANEFHEMEWYRDEFYDMLTPFFEDVELRVQIRSLQLVCRQDATRALKEHLAYLWASPSVRLARWVGNFRGRGVVWPDIEGLASPSMADYPIVLQDQVALLGTSFCHFAICRNPRK